MAWARTENLSGTGYFEGEVAAVLQWVERDQDLAVSVE